MPARLISDNATVTTAGTRVPLSTYSQPVKWVQLQAKAGSDGAIVVGCALVIADAATRKGVIVPEESADGANVIEPLILEGPLDLANVYLDATTNTQTVNYLAEPESRRMYGGIQEIETVSHMSGRMAPGRVFQRTS